MKNFIKFSLIYISLIAPAYAGFTVTWTPPTENTDGSPLTDLDGYKLWCLFADQEYGPSPWIIQPGETSYVKHWADPGDWKCKMRAFNASGTDSPDSPEIFFKLVDADGTGNGVLAAPGTPQNRGSVMQIIRKGYYTIRGPDGNLLNNDEGGLRQCTTRDKCYEYVTRDGRTGTFIIEQPPIEVIYK